LPTTSGEGRKANREKPETRISKLADLSCGSTELEKNLLKLLTHKILICKNVEKSLPALSEMRVPPTLPVEPRRE
jgi:hypothetical protein